MLEKIQHYLGLFFLLSLIFTQALVYVAVVAQDTDINNGRSTSFQAIFIQPLAGQPLAIGQSVQLQAHLSPVNNYSAVTFAVRAAIGNPELNFEASRQNDGSWRANNVWNTSGWSAGVYNLSVAANIYNANGTLQNSFVSSAQSISLIPPASDANGATDPGPNAHQTLQIVSSFSKPQEGQSIVVDKSRSENIALELSVERNNTFSISKVSGDVYYQASSTAEFVRQTTNLAFTLATSTASQYLYTGSLEPSSYLAGDYKIRSRAEVLLANASSSQSLELNSVTFKISLVSGQSGPTIKIIAPTKGQVLDQPLSVTVELSRPLAAGHNLQAYLIEKSVAPNPLLSKYQDRLITLRSAGGQPLIYRAILDPTKYASGDYSWLVYDASNVQTSLLGSVNLSVARSPATPVIFLESPSSGAVVKDNSLYFSIRTSALADTLQIELAKADSPAISTREISIDKTDGTNWQRSIFLDHSFIDGLYNIIISAQLAKQTLATSSPSAIAKYTLILSRQKESWDTKSIVLTLEEAKSVSSFGPDFDFSGLTNLSAASNIRSGQVYFVFQNSLDKKESLRLVHNDISEEVDSNGARQYKYRTVLDSSALVNGNYYLSAELYYNNKLISVTADKLISIYNVADSKEPLTTDSREGQSLADNPPQENTPPRAEGAMLKSLAVGLFATCGDVNIKNNDSCQVWRAMVESVLGRRCTGQNIYAVAACEDYLNRTVVDLECQSQGLVDKGKCKDYLLEKYGANVDCRLSDQMACATVLREQYLNRLVINQRERALVNAAVLPLLGQSVTLEQLSQQIKGKGLNQVRLALQATADIKVLLVRSHSEAILEEVDRLTMISEAILVLDSDADGLPDDLERYYGTASSEADSDHDGYNDSVEIKNGYNPLGDGALNKERTALDRVLLAGTSLEQPKILADRPSNDLVLRVLDNGEKGVINFSGLAPARSWVALYIYSDLPLLVSAQADDQGYWQYSLGQRLSEGSHRIFVAISDSTGQIDKQSAPLSFLIKEARAVTAEQYFNQTENSRQSLNFNLYYINGGAVLALLLLVGIIFWLRRRSKRMPLE